MTPRYKTVKRNEFKTLLRRRLVDFCKADMWAGLERGSKFAVKGMFDAMTEEIMFLIKRYYELKKEDADKPKNV